MEGFAAEVQRIRRSISVHTPCKHCPVTAKAETHQKEAYKAARRSSPSGHGPPGSRVIVGPILLFLQPKLTTISETGIAAGLCSLTARTLRQNTHGSFADWQNRKRKVG